MTGEKSFDWRNNERFHFVRNQFPRMAYTALTLYIPKGNLRAWLSPCAYE